jgi:hypothetical protein
VSPPILDLDDVTHVRVIKEPAPIRVAFGFFYNEAVRLGQRERRILPIPKRQTTAALSGVN